MLSDSMEAVDFNAWVLTLHRPILVDVDDQYAGLFGLHTRGKWLVMLRKATGATVTPVGTPSRVWRLFDYVTDDPCQTDACASEWYDYEFGRYGFRCTGYCSDPEYRASWRREAGTVVSEYPTDEGG